MEILEPEYLRSVMSFWISWIDINYISPNSESTLLVPGIGAQGGDLQDVAKYGMNQDCGILVNSSRGIIYASDSLCFAEKTREVAQKLQKKMSVLLSEKGI